MRGFWRNPVALEELYFRWLLAKNDYFYRCCSVVVVVLCVCVCVLLSSVSFPSHKPYLERYRIS